jgi:CHASE2 domain-containing sensor protein
MNAADRLDAFANTLGLIGVVLGLAYLPGDLVERRLLNERFLARDAAPPAHPDLVVVSLDDRYAARRHYPVTTSTGYVTQVVEALTAGGARVIALDIAVTDGDTAGAEFPELVRALNAAPAVVLPSILSVHGVRADRPPSFRLAAEPPAAVRALAPSGFVTFVDAAHPRIQLVARLDDRTLAASFALRAVQAHIGLLPHEPDVWQREGGSHRIAERELALLVDSLGLAADGADPATAAQRARLINYTGPVEPGSALAYISSEDLLAGLVLPAQLQDRLVVVGAMHRGAADDRFDTPWGRMHGVELHANIMRTACSPAAISRSATPAAGRSPSRSRRCCSCCSAPPSPCACAARPRPS